MAGLAGILGFHNRSSTSTVAIGGGTATTTTGPPASASKPQLGPSPAPTNSSAPATATGKGEQYGYGTLDVRVTVSGGKIVDLSVPQLQTAEQYSQQLAAQVIPMLRSEVLSAQSAQISGISGATYTSEAYAISLQSALDQLHFK